MSHSSRPSPQPNDSKASHVPHQYPASFSLRCLEALMRTTHDHPQLMKPLSLLGGATALSLRGLDALMRMSHSHPRATKALSFVGAATALGLSPYLSLSMPKVAAVAAGAAASAVGYLQSYIFGMPKDDKCMYQDAKTQYQNATAELIVKDGHMPLLHIKADNHFDAGYVEGTALAPAMHTVLKSFLSMYSWSRLALGAPQSHDVAALRKYLDPIIKTIPAEYQDEMHGKILAYNNWLKKNKPGEDLLSFEFYIFLQLQPDLRNYNPFKGSAPPVDSACTTIALQHGDYTGVARVLDWSSLDVANSLLQIRRSINGKKTTTDIGLPVLSGLLTAVNEHGLLVEMNVAYGNKIKKPNGMPAVFFNRVCAENASSTNQIQDVLARHQPLSAYHLTATDGVNTTSFHFHQSLDKKGEHVIEQLDGKLAPVMVVANGSIKVVGDKVESYNYKDSNERRKNVMWFFDKAKVLPNLDEKRSPDEVINELNEALLGAARLPLVNNHASALCALYIYHKGKLVSGKAAIDNNYAPDRPLSQFKRLALG